MYGEKVSDFWVGDRVELHPATDCWMSGAKYGTVTKLGRKWVHVRHDHGMLHLHQPRNLRRTGFC